MVFGGWQCKWQMISEAAVVGEFRKCPEFSSLLSLILFRHARHFTLFLHAIVTIIRLGQPGRLRSVVAESVSMRHQVLILNRGWKRAPNLRASDRIIAAFSQNADQTKVPAAVFTQNESVGRVPKDRRKN